MKSKSLKNNSLKKQNFKEEKESVNININKLKEDLQINNHKEDKNIFFYGKTYLEESGEDDYSKIQIPIKKLYSFKKDKKENNFVPKPKPLEIHFIPSKLQLNPCSIKNKKYSCSCPNTQDSSSDFISCDEDRLKDLRKKLQNLKSTVPKTFSKAVVNNNNFEFENDDYKNEDGIDIYSGSENEYEIDNLKFVKGENNNNGKRNFRFNSCSILQILQNKI
jgi:hypothetical protein